MNMQQHHLPVGVASAPPQYAGSRPVSATPTHGGYGITVWSVWRPNQPNETWRLYVLDAFGNGLVPDSAEFIATVVVPEATHHPSALATMVHVFADRTS